MKKFLVLLTVAVGIFCFSTGAFAQLADVCSTCPSKCTIGTIACPGSQGGTCVDYNFQASRGGVNCHAIFAICNCLNAGTVFVHGKVIGIRMTILVNGLPGQNGAYWVGGAAAADVQFAMFAHQADACAATAFGTYHFGEGKFYKTDAAGKQSGDPVTTLAAGTTACAIPAANQATMIVTDPDRGYTITPEDEETKTSYWWINIPLVRVDPAVLHNCERISVKIETLDQGSGGICADCVASCACTIDIANVCCTTASSNTCTFPYFTSTGASGSGNPFWNGIAVVNTSNGAGTATLTVTQKDGKTGTFTTPSIPAGSMYVSTLANIAFTGTGLGGVPLWIKAVSTFSGIEGFAMIANTATGESMGYLCRKPNN